MGTLDTRAICYGLMRAGGAVGFAFGVGAALYVGRAQLGVAVHHTTAFAEMTRQQIVVVVIAILAGMIGAVIGQGFGASISVSDDRTSQSFDALWHFSANTVIIWIPAAWLLFGLVMGRGPLEEYWQAHSFAEMMWLGFVLPLAAGLSTALVLWFSVEAVPTVAGVLPAFVLTNISPFIVCGGCGVYAATELGLAPAYGLPLALLPVLIMPVSLEMIRKDKNRRLGG